MTSTPPSATRRWGVSDNEAFVTELLSAQIASLRDENAALRAEIDRLRARENVIAQHEDTGRTWNGPRCAIPSRYFEVNTAEQEVERA